MYRLHKLCALILVAGLGALACQGACAQSLQIQPEAASPSLQNAASIQPEAAAPAAPQVLPDAPDAPGAQAPDLPAADGQSGGGISGTVLDARGAEVTGARVTLEINRSR